MDWRVSQGQSKKRNAENVNVKFFFNHHWNGSGAAKRSYDA